MKMVNVGWFKGKLSKLLFFIKLSNIFLRKLYIDCAKYNFIENH